MFCILWKLEKKVLLLGHSCRAHQFTTDKYIRYCEDMGLAKTHQIYFRDVGGRKSSNIIKHYANCELLGYIGFT